MKMSCYSYSASFSCEALDDDCMFIVVFLEAFIVRWAKKDSSYFPALLFQACCKLQSF